MLIGNWRNSLCQLPIDFLPIDANYFANCPNTRNDSIYGVNRCRFMCANYFYYANTGANLRNLFNLCG